MLSTCTERGAEWLKGGRRDGAERAPGPATAPTHLVAAVDGSEREPWHDHAVGALVDLELALGHGEAVGAALGEHVADVLRGGGGR